MERSVFEPTEAPAQEDAQSCGRNPTNEQFTLQDLSSEEQVSFPDAEFQGVVPRHSASDEGKSEDSKKLETPKKSSAQKILKKLHFMRKDMSQQWGTLDQTLKSMKEQANIICAADNTSTHSLCHDVVVELAAEKQ